jgi:hypothetical protein
MAYGWSQVRPAQSALLTPPIWPQFRLQLAALFDDVEVTEDV